MSRTHPAKQLIVLHVNGDEYRVAVDPFQTLAAVLREELGLTGTKVGCGTGDCGACTVILDGRSVTSCLTLAVEAAGREIVTVEGLTDSGRQLHPIQRAFVEEGAIQCGFCTPGMEMSTLYLLSRNPHPTEADIRAGLSGNLCRCTGYDGIIRAVERAAEEMAGEIAGPVRGQEGLDVFPSRDSRESEDIAKTAPAALEVGYVAPCSVEEVCAILAAAKPGEAALLAGGTDLLPKMRAVAPRARPSIVVGLRAIPELATLRADRRLGLHIGSTVRLADVAGDPAVEALYPAVAAGAAATATPQIRNMATLVGNLCNAAPSADNAPALLALDAELHIAGPAGRRTLPLRQFFRGPGETSLGGGEVVTAVTTSPPPPHSGQSYQCFSQRSRVDISAVGAAALLVLDDDGVCIRAAVALGGVAPTPLRAGAAEEVLVGQRLACQERTPRGAGVVLGASRDAEGAFVEAAAVAVQAARPIDDLRATAAYRRRVAQVLTERALADALARALDFKDISASGSAARGEGRPA